MLKIGKLFHLTHIMDALDAVDRESKGHLPVPDGEDSIILGADQAFGMVIGFTQRALPGDPR